MYNFLGEFMKKFFSVFFIFFVFISCATTVVMEKKDVAKLYFNLGNSYNNLGKKKEAVDSYMTALSYDRDLTVSSYNLVLLLMDEKRYKDAEKILLDLISSSEYNSIYYEVLAYNYFNQKKYKEALDIYEEILKREKLNKKALYNSSLIYTFIGEKERALEKLLEYKDIIEDNKDILKQIAELYSGLGNKEQAIKFYKDYLVKNSSDKDVKKSYAKLLFEIKDFKKALDIYEELDGSSNKDGELVFFKAKVLLLGLEDLGKGKEAVERALDLGYEGADELYQITLEENFLYKDEFKEFLKEKNFYFEPGEYKKYKEKMEAINKKIEETFTSAKKNFVEESDFSAGTNALKKLFKIDEFEDYFKINTEILLNPEFKFKDELKAWLQNRGKMELVEGFKEEEKEIEEEKIVE